MNLPTPLPAEPVVIFAGRHIPEKRVTAVVPAVVRARTEIHDLRCEIFGEGSDRDAVLLQIAAGGLGEVADAPGFVSQERLEQSLARALCLLLPSSREGYGLIVVEAAARGVPSIVIAGADNAATELIEEGVNGFVAPSASSEDIAAAVVRVRDAGPELRRSTADWFAAHADELSLTSSLRLVSRLLPGQARESA